MKSTWEIDRAVWCIITIKMYKYNILNVYKLSLNFKLVTFIVFSCTVVIVFHLPFCSWIYMYTKYYTRRVVQFEISIFPRTYTYMCACVCVYLHTYTYHLYLPTSFTVVLLHIVARLRAFFFFHTRTIFIIINLKALSSNL